MVDLIISNRKNLVTQDNELISASYSLSLNEKRLIILAFSKINPMLDFWKGDGLVSITASEFSEVFNVDMKNAYNFIKSAQDSLSERWVRLEGDYKNGKEIRWLDGKEYSSNEGMITMGFSSRMLKSISGMSEFFTSYKLLAVSRLKSTYSIRIYELTQQFKSTGWRLIQLDELRNLLRVGYPDWRDLKKRVIDPACKELNEKSDIHISYEIIKKGRTIVAVKLLTKAKK